MARRRAGRRVAPGSGIRAARPGCQRIALDTTQPLERAMRFYEKNGYQRSGKVSDLFGMPLVEYVKPC